MMRTQWSRLIVAASLLFSAAVCAEEAYTTRQVNVRAGPARDYPLVATLAADTPVDVTGCVTDYSWCDVIYGNIRGWVYAKGLRYTYLSQQVPLYSYGAIIGVPIVTFSLLSYWDNHYRNRPFYRDRPRWENHSYPGRPGYMPPRPSAPQYRPPRPPEPQFHPGRPGGEPQYRPPRPMEPQTRPQRQPEPQTRPQRPSEPQYRPPGGERPNVPPPQRPQGGRPSGGEKFIDRTPPSREPGGN